MSEAENEALARQAYEALEAGDDRRFLALCAADIEWVYPVNRALPYGGHWSGIEGVQRFFGAHEAAEETLEMSVSEFVASADKVLVRGRFRGRARGTGREWETEFTHVLHIKDGRIQRFAAAFDTRAAVLAHAVLH